MKRILLNLAFLILSNIVFSVSAQAQEPYGGPYQRHHEHRFRDGAAVKVHYNPSDLRGAGESELFAAQVLKSAVRAYRVIVEEMGFSTPGYSFSEPNPDYAHDPDRTIDIYLGSGAVFKDAPCFDTVRISDAAAHAVILLPAGYREFIKRWERINPSPLGPRDIYTDLQGTLIHEMLHAVLFYYNRNLRRDGAQDPSSDLKTDWYVEGLARYFETLAGAKHDFYSQGFKQTLPDKVRFSRGGSNYFLRYPDQAFTDLRYENALFWKYVHDRFGMKAIERLSRRLRRDASARAMKEEFGVSNASLLSEFAAAALLKSFKMGGESAFLKEIARSRLIFRRGNFFLLDGNGTEKKLGPVCRTDWVGLWSGERAAHGWPSVGGDSTDGSDVSPGATDYYEIDFTKSSGRLPVLELRQKENRVTNRLGLQAFVFYDDGSFASRPSRGYAGVDLSQESGVAKVYLLVSNPSGAALEYEILSR